MSYTINDIKNIVQTLANKQERGRIRPDGQRGIVGTNQKIYRSTNAMVTFAETLPAGNTNQIWQLATTT